MPISKHKILVVNNHTQHLASLKKALRGHELEIVKYEPGVVFNDAGKDLVILSGGGGEGLEIDDLYDGKKLWYEDEMEFVLRTEKPVLGICMGFEIIAKAYGAQINEMPNLVQGFMPISPTGHGREWLEQSSLSQFESHNWHVPGVSSKHFDILAESSTGIEMIRHKKRNILATQFHPEVAGGTLGLPFLVRQAAAQYSIAF